MRFEDAEQLVERWRGVVGTVAGALIFTLLLVFPLPGLKPEAQRLAAIVAFTGTFWLSEPIPLPMTGLIAVALCVLLQVADAKTALAGFSDPIVFLFLGSFMLAEAMHVHRLDRRIAMALLSRRWVGGSPLRIMLTMGGISAFLSMWLSNTATTAMLIPVALGILREFSALREPAPQEGNETIPSTPYATALVLAVAFGASIGGLATPIGTPPNLIGVGLIEKLTGERIAFVAWMKFGVPIVVVLMAVLLLVLRFLFPPPRERSEGMAGYLAARHREMGRLSPGEWNTLAAFLAAVFLWTFPGVLALMGEFGVEWAASYSKWLAKILPEGMVALLAAGLLFLLPTSVRQPRPTLTWAQASHIDWGTILLFGAGISLGTLMFSTGLAEAMGRSVLALTGVSGLPGITLVVMALGILVSETTSNTASANMIIPLAISMAQEAGVDPVVPALGACFGASFGFMLPVSTPPNAIAYGTGLVPLLRMVTAGLILDVVGLFIMWGMILVLCGGL